jgi:RNA polymerase sigma factor (sigma-70 family)
MNVHVSYKVAKTSDLEKQINQQIQKLGKRLQLFRPELVHLHASVDDSSARQGCTVSLNLRLPSGQMASKGAADKPLPAIKRAFDDLIEQLTKHMDHLRSHYKWPRRKREGEEIEPQFPFEETVAAVHPEMVSKEDVTQYVNVNLYRFTRFVDRELRYRESVGMLLTDQVTCEEVIDEAIANALGDSIEKPEKLSLEPWLYRLALRAIDSVVERNSENDGDVCLEARARRMNVEASDETRMQYHQPDEAVVEQDQIADIGTATPEDIAYSEEVINLVESALTGAKPEDREAFLLYAIEGFTPDEIAAISERKIEDVRRSVISARECLKKALPVPDEFKSKLLQHSRIA